MAGRERAPVARGGRGVSPDGASGAVVRVRMLGGFEVSVGAVTVAEDAWRLKKAAGLVKLLALEPGHRMHREKLMDLLWPGLDQRAAANNLRGALHAARRTLAPAPASLLRLRDEHIELEPDGELRIDVEAFEGAAADARGAREPAAYRSALELYAGELLPGDRYEAWTEERREALRLSYISLLVGLARLHEERGETEAGIAALERAVEAEPAHEEAHAGLMRLHALAGRPRAAALQYERLRGALAVRSEGPTAASRRLRDEINAGQFPPPPTSREEKPEGSPRALSNNLPLPRSSFVGRENELVEVKRELAMTRLLTLTGAGGSGKTRLALEVARDLAGAYPDGAWMVELAPLSEGDLIPQAVAAALKVREQPGRPLADTLVSHLRNRRMLLLLDNCEHVVDAAASLADGLLSSCPGLRVLATSREALRADGEVVWRVPSLSLPEAEPPSAPEELVRYESVRLFAERARSRRPDFLLAPGNASAVAGICRGLDGVPLAIELAAARVGVLSAAQIHSRLSDSLALLRGGGRTAMPRHQTLRGTLDWSHELLDTPEKRLFARLSVFAGGFTLEAAEAVGEGAGEGGVLDLLEALVDKSLVVTDGTPSGVRYRLLEPVRQYAREKLGEDEEAGEAHRRHALWYLALSEEAETELTGPDYQEWLRRLEVEHDNLRTALGWSLDGGEAELGLRLAAALWLFWYTHGHLAEGRRWLERALAATA